MFTAKRNGKTYECPDADQLRVWEIFNSNGGDLEAAVRRQFVEKYGEPFGDFDTVSDIEPKRE